VISSSLLFIGFIARELGTTGCCSASRDEDVYLELMGDRSYVYELAKRLERNIG
jgi:hypothetical protein